MNQTLHLLRPLVAFDLETTGLDIQTDRIVEVACIKMFPDGTEARLCSRCNPEMPISPGASAVHGIADADVAAEPTFAQLAEALYTFLEGADLTGFNVEKFDLPLLRREFARVGREFPHPGAAQAARVIDSMRIFMRNEPRDLAAAYRFYCGKPLQAAHSAAADAAAAAAILQAQIGRYAELPNQVAELDAYCHPKHPDAIDDDGKLIWVGADVALGFGRYRQRTLRDLCRDDPAYLRWVAGANFSSAVVEMVQGALSGRFPQRPAGSVEAAPHT